MRVSEFPQSCVVNFRLHISSVKATKTSFSVQSEDEFVICVLINSSSRHVLNQSLAASLTFEPKRHGTTDRIPPTGRWDFFLPNPQLLAQILRDFLYLRNFIHLKQ